MKYLKVKQLIEQLILEGDGFLNLNVKIEQHAKVMPAIDINLPTLTIVIDSAKVEDREGRATQRKAVAISIVLVESDSRTYEHYLPFFESIFVKDYLPINMNDSKIIKSDLRYGGFNITHKNDGERFLTFLKINLILNIEESL